MATIRIVNLQQLNRQIGRLSLGERQVAMRNALVKSGFLVARNAQNAMKRGGQGRPLAKKLTSRTGTGRRSIRADRPRVGKLQSSVAVGTDLRYMAAHETGGTFIRKAHTRRTPSGKTANVKAHPFSLPERPFLKPGLRKSRKEIEQIFVRTWAAALR